MNLLKKDHRERFFKAFEKEDRRWRPFRASRYQLLSDYVGPSFPEEFHTTLGWGGADLKTGRNRYINLMLQTAETYQMAFAAQRPRFSISTQFSELEYFRTRYELALNRRIAEIELEEVFSMAVLEAFFTIGIVKVYQADHYEVMAEGDIRFDPGRSAAGNISIDNFVGQMGVDVRRMEFAGDFYRIPFEQLERDDRFERDVVKELRPSKRREYSHDGDRLAADLSWGGENAPEDIDDMIELVDVFFPRDNRVATFPVSSEHRFAASTKPLSYLPWDGPETGPYHYLNFGDVPDNIMGISLAANLQELSATTDNLARKAVLQARMQKDYYAVAPGSGNDAKNHRKAKQGDLVTIEDPDGLKLVSVPGVNASNQLAMNMFIDLHDRFAGNLQSMAALGPQAATLGQEELIAAGVGKREAKIMMRVARFDTRIGRDIGHLMWLDEALEMPLEIKVPGTKIVERTAWTPEEREGDFLDYNFEVDMYSLAYQSPAQKLSFILSMVDRYAQMSQLMMDPNSPIDFEELNEAVSIMGNSPEMRRIVKMSPIGSDNRPKPYREEDGGMPASTRREYVRKSKPALNNPQNRAAANTQLLAQMAGASPTMNQDQLAGAM